MECNKIQTQRLHNRNSNRTDLRMENSQSNDIYSHLFQLIFGERKKQCLQFEGELRFVRSLNQMQN